MKQLFAILALVAASAANAAPVARPDQPTNTLYQAALATCKPLQAQMTGEQMVAAIRAAGRDAGFSSRDTRLMMLLCAMYVEGRLDRGHEDAAIMERSR